MNIPPRVPRDYQLKHCEIVWATDYLRDQELADNDKFHLMKFRFSDPEQPNLIRTFQYVALVNNVGGQVNVRIDGNDVRMTYPHTQLIPNDMREAIRLHAINKYNET